MLRKLMGRKRPVVKAIREECPDCEGGGVIEHITTTVLYGMRFNQRKCPRCNGTGQVEKENME